MRPRQENTITYTCVGQVKRYRAFGEAGMPQEFAEWVREQLARQKPTGK
ncbi:MAG: hypothetical protein HY318_17760 [Armatimonadetes bacterium]|nr:hypothetical protein [Armatimonadota bacterium]